MNRHHRPAAEQQIARGAYHLSPTDRERFVIGTDHSTVLARASSAKC